MKKIFTYALGVFAALALFAFAPAITHAEVAEITGISISGTSPRMTSVVGSDGSSSSIYKLLNGGTYSNIKFEISTKNMSPNTPVVYTVENKLPAGSEVLFSNNKTSVTLLYPYQTQSVPLTIKAPISCSYYYVCKGSFTVTARTASDPSSATITVPVLFSDIFILGQSASSVSGTLPNNTNSLSLYVAPVDLMESHPEYITFPNIVTTPNNIKPIVTYVGRDLTSFPIPVAKYNVSFNRTALNPATYPNVQIALNRVPYNTNLWNDISYTSVVFNTSSNVKPFNVAMGIQNPNPVPGNSFATFYFGTSNGVGSICDDPASITGTCARYIYSVTGLPNGYTLDIPTTNNDSTRFFKINVPKDAVAGTYNLTATFKGSVKQCADGTNVYNCAMTTAQEYVTVPFQLVVGQALSLTVTTDPTVENGKPFVFQVKYDDKPVITQSTKIYTNKTEFEAAPQSTSFLHVYIEPNEFIQWNGSFANAIADINQGQYALQAWANPPQSGGPITLGVRYNGKTSYFQKSVVCSYCFQDVLDTSLNQEETKTVQLKRFDSGSLRASSGPYVTITPNDGGLLVSSSYAPTDPRTPQYGPDIVLSLTGKKNGTYSVKTSVGLTVSGIAGPVYPEKTFTVTVGGATNTSSLKISVAPVNRALKAKQEVHPDVVVTPINMKSVEDPRVAITSSLLKPQIAVSDYSSSRKQVDIVANASITQSVAIGPNIRVSVSGIGNDNKPYSDSALVDIGVLKDDIIGTSCSMSVDKSVITLKKSQLPSYPTFMFTTDANNLTYSVSPNSSTMDSTFGGSNSVSLLSAGRYANLMLSVGKSTPVGTYPFTVTGTNALGECSSSVALYIQDETVTESSFKLSANPSPVTIEKKSMQASEVRTTTITASDFVGISGTSPVWSLVAPSSAPGITAALISGNSNPQTLRFVFDKNAVIPDSSYTYNVTATYKSTSGADVSKTISIPVIVNSGALSCSLVANPASGPSPLTTTLTATPQGGIAPYTYQFKKDDASGYVPASGPSTSFTYTASSNAYVKVTDNANDKAICSTPVTITTGGGDFDISITPTPQYTTKDTSTYSYDVIANRSGYNGTIQLSVASADSGITVSSESSIPAKESKASVSVTEKSLMPAGTVYNFSITATGGGKTRTKSASLIVPTATVVPVGNSNYPACGCVFTAKKIGVYDKNNPASAHTTLAWSCDSKAPVGTPAKSSDNVGRFIIQKTSTNGIAPYSWAFAVPASTLNVKDAIGSQSVTYNPNTTYGLSCVDPKTPMEFQGGREF